MSQKRPINKFKCPKKIWNGFGAPGQRAYNNVRAIEAKNFTHPKTKLSPEEWKTISHNMACLAAWEVKDYMKVLQVTLIS